MVRILNLLAVMALIGSAIYAYSIKYETIYHAERIVKLKHEIKAEQDQIGMLRAEWAHLTRPGAHPGAGRQASRPAADRLDPDRQRARPCPPRAPKIDAIGRKLEALGLAEPTRTPRDGAASAPPTPAAPVR